MSLLSNLRIMAMKAESAATPGTPVTVADADFDVRVRGVSITPTIEVDDENSKHSTGDHGEDCVTPGAQSMTVSCTVRMAWGGAVAVEPLWWKLAKACGCKVESFTTVGLGLEPIKEADQQTYTIYVQDIERSATPKAVQYILGGCMGNMVMSCEGVGKPWMATFEFTGKIVSKTDILEAAILELTSPSTICGEKNLSNTVNLGGVASKVSAWSLDIGNEIQPEIDQSDATGYSHYAITARRPRFTANPLRTLVATDDIYGKWAAGTVGTSSITSAAASPHFTLHMPQTQILTAADAEREGLLGWDLNYKCLRNGSTSANIADECGWQLLQGAYA